MIYLIPCALVYALALPALWSLLPIVHASDTLPCTLYSDDGASSKDLDNEMASALSGALSSLTYVDQIYGVPC
jgi:hypothetical protein